MIKINSYIILVFIFFIIVFCSIYPSHSSQDKPIYLYQSAKKKLKKTNYHGAIQDLIKLKNLYLFEPCAQQIHLDLIYTYYKLNDLESANHFSQKFLQLYPNHKHFDYVLYMHGIINMTLDTQNKTLIKYLKIHWFDRNPKYAHIAFKSFIHLLHKYPNSQYSADSQKRLFFLKNRLSEYELAIIKFYDKKHAYISVILRTEKMLYHFPDTQATLQALYYMQKAYYNMQLTDQSDKLKKIISINSKY